MWASVQKAHTGKRNIHSWQGGCESGPSSQGSTTKDCTVLGPWHWGVTDPVLGSLTLWGVPDTVLGHGMAASPQPVCSDTAGSHGCWSWRADDSGGLGQPCSCTLRGVPRSAALTLQLLPRTRILPGHPWTEPEMFIQLWVLSVWHL